MATKIGYVTVYETSDGGTGDPAQTFWGFFVESQPMSTNNPLIAETMRLAITTSRKVRATYDDTKQNTMSQARIAFKYVCESHVIQKCDSPETEQICETRRLSPCDPNEKPTDIDD